jgi:hypothetical protein
MPMREQTEVETSGNGIRKYNKVPKKVECSIELINMKIAKFYAQANILCLHREQTA